MKDLNNKKLSKREFLKCGICGACALAVGSLPDAFAGGQGLWKWSREAYFYSKEGSAVYCDICPNECIIRPGKYGDCNTRINKGGKLYTIGYGNPCAVHVDPIEKKPLYHFLPSARAFSVAVAGCNLSCMNCQNWEISQSTPMETCNYDLMPEKLVESAQKYNCQTIAYTYSEPIVFYEYTYDSAKLASKKGIRNLLVTAGYIKEKPLRKLCEVIDAANVDLKSFDNEIYKKLNAGSLQPVLDTLKILKQEKVWIEITNLIVPTWTDDMKMIRRMCRWLADNGFANYPLHFSRFHPMYKLAHLPPTPEKVLRRARDIAMEEGISYVFIGNAAISDAEDTICPKCGKTVIERTGFSIRKNNLKNGSCGNCGTKIHGVWK